MSTLTSENGVEVDLPSFFTAEDTVNLRIPVLLLVSLQRAWQNDGPDNTQVVEAVRDLFDGQDGHLTFLDMIGVHA
jgi:hypothetical protein